MELWRSCEAQGITELWLEATPPTLAVYRRLGFPLKVVGELRTHWGEDCYLCRMGVAEVADCPGPPRLPVPTPAAEWCGWPPGKPPPDDDAPAGLPRRGTSSDHSGVILACRDQRRDMLMGEQ